MFFVWLVGFRERSSSVTCPRSLRRKQALDTQNQKKKLGTQQKEVKEVWVISTLRRIISLLSLCVSDHTMMMKIIRFDDPIPIDCVIHRNI